MNKILFLSFVLVNIRRNKYQSRTSVSGLFEVFPAYLGSRFESVRKARLCPQRLEKFQKRPSGY